MPWGSGTYTRTNGQFNGNDVWQDDAANLIKIESDRHDTHDQDVADGISACLNRNGENGMTVDLQMGGNKITAIAPATAGNEAISLDQMNGRIPSTATENTLVTWQTDGYKEVLGVAVIEDFFVGSLAGNAATAAAWDTPINLNLIGNVTGTVAFNGSEDVNLTCTVTPNSHAHTIGNVTGLTAALDAKLDATATAVDSDKVDGWDVEVVTTLPGTPDANTLYFVTT